MEQRDRIKKIFKDKNLKINDIVAKLFPQGKGSYYHEVDKKPLKEEFIKAVKDEYNIDLVKELIDQENQERPDKWGDPTLSYDYLLKENILLLRKLREYEQKETIDLDKVVELKKKIDDLTDLLNKKMG